MRASSNDRRRGKEADIIMVVLNTVVGSLEDIDKSIDPAELYHPIDQGTVRRWRREETQRLSNVDVYGWMPESECTTKRIETWWVDDPTKERP